MFDDIVKVTPSSKVVGDMALYMIANDLSASDILDTKKEITFPKSVIEFFRGELGVPYGGFPKELQERILGNLKPLKGRPGETLPSTNLKDVKNKVEKITEQSINDQQLASYLMYPKVFIDFINFQKKFSDPSILPTPLFFYGPQTDKEYSLKIDEGKSLIVRYLTRGKTKPDGYCSVFFELNGQTRTIEILDESFIEKKDIEA
jgi:Pyruvate carboxylase